MAALVQSYPQQTSTVTMLQTRPSSASGILQGSASGQVHHQYPGGTAQMQLHAYNGVTSVGSSTYRGQTTMASAAPYAFNGASGLSTANFRPQLSPYLRNDQTKSAPTISSTYSPETGHGGARSRYPTAASISASSSSSSELSAGTQQSFTRDDSAIASTAWVATRVARPHSTVITSLPSPGLPAANSPHTPTKPSPDRYRRPAQRRTETSGSSTSQHQNPPSSPAAVGSNMSHANQMYAQPAQSTNPRSVNAHQGFTQPPHMSSSVNKFTSFSPNLGLRAAVDDAQLRQPPPREEASRYRRRSIHTIDMANPSDAQLRAMAQQGPRQGFMGGLRQDHQDPLRSSPFLANRPASSPGRSAGLEMATRNGQAPSAPTGKRELNTLIAPSPTTPAPVAGAADEAPSNKLEQLQLVHIPPRGSSTDAAKRNTSSPLSKPMTMNAESPVSKDSFASTVSAALQTPAKATYAQVVQGTRPQSPAARQLAALNDKDGKKSKPSRLRRAFSFGSAAELRKASEDNDAVKATAVEGAERSRLRKERYQDEREAEQARIAQQQEAGGIGQGIYSGQGKFFSGSTDNLSISSTASSASIMIRKMGQGVKKSTRSLVGLFRPKSVVGVPAAQAAVPQPSQAEVSMVTVEAEREAERERVNVNASAHDQAGGGTGFPRLERNSIDAAVSASSPVDERTSSSDSTDARKSILGGDKERAEVLAAVKKGILKRAATDSPQASPRVKPVDVKIDGKATNFTLPPLPNMNDSPASSTPSTPNDDAHGHKRSGSVTLGGEDYFMTALRFQVDSKSVPSTPPGVAKRNATFSPRIQFHDTWPSGEYDRRGEIATCNRLTPMLAQQIKEELNTFKMEMEVHENSKIYTHFF